MAPTAPRWYAELTHAQAACFVGVLTRANSIPGSQQTHRSRVLNKLHAQLKDFEQARLDLIKVHAVLDAAGEPVIDGEAYKMKDQKAFDTAFTALAKDLPVILDGRTDEVMNRALNAAYEILTTDLCPALAPPMQGQPFELSEGYVFVQLVDAFTKSA